MLSCETECCGKFPEFFPHLHKFYPNLWFRPAEVLLGSIHSGKSPVDSRKFTSLPDIAENFWGCRIYGKTDFVEAGLNQQAGPAIGEEHAVGLEPDPSFRLQ
jgi:hypothetical protein